MSIWKAVRAASVALVLLFLTSGSESRPQYTSGPRQGLTTTDDPRRVPIPPKDLSNAPVLVLKGGTLIDGTEAGPVPNAVLVIRGNTIVDVGPADQIRVPPNPDKVIDVTGLHIVPGLIDLHIHFSQQRGDDFRRYRDSDAAAAIRSIALLEQLLDGGITAVRELGGPGDVALRLKEAVFRGIIRGPRVFSALKFIAIRGGHTDASTSTGSGLPRSLATDPRVRVATGPDDWRLAVREQIRMGADLIKVTAPYTRDEIAAAIDEAHMHGFRVTADAFGDYITWAAEEGLDSLEHPLGVPDSALTAMAKNGTAFVPTLVAFYNLLEYGYPSAGIGKGGFFYTFSRRFPVDHRAHMETVEKARRLGITVGVGSDVPFENEKRYPVDYFTELGLLQQAGFTNAELLASATRIGAEILDLPDKLGTLERGKLADILVVAGDPLRDILHLRNLRLLVADGRVVRDRLSSESTATSE